MLKPRASNPVLILAGFLMPYLAVGAGLYIFHSAWVAIFAYHVGILLFVIPAGGLTWDRLFFPGYARSAASIWNAILWGVVGLLAGVGVWILWPLLPLSASLSATLRAWGLSSPWQWVWFILYSAIVNPWLEELYWRDWMGSTSRRPVLADLFFAGFHLVILASFLTPFWLVVSFLILALTAWLWRRATVRYNSLLAAWLCHLAADVSILLVIVSEVM